MITSKSIIDILESRGADPSVRGELSGYGSWLPAARSDLDPLVIKKKNRELLLAMYKDQKVKSAFINTFKSLKGMSLIPTSNMSILTLTKTYSKTFPLGLFARYIKGSQGRYKLSALDKIVTQVEGRVVLPPLKVNINQAFSAYVHLDIDTTHGHSYNDVREEITLNIVLSLQDILDSEVTEIKSSKPLTVTEVLNLKLAPIKKMIENAIRLVDAMISEVTNLETVELKLDFKKQQLNQFITNRIPTD